MSGPHTEEPQQVANEIRALRRPCPRCAATPGRYCRKDDGWGGTITGICPERKAAGRPA